MSQGKRKTAEQIINYLRQAEVLLAQGHKREYVQVLRLLETFDLRELHGAVRDTLRLGAIGYDAVKHLLLWIWCAPELQDRGEVVPSCGRTGICRRSVPFRCDVQSRNRGQARRYLCSHVV
jgi:hypothetical protein